MCSRRVPAEQQVPFGRSGARSGSGLATFGARIGTARPGHTPDTAGVPRTRTNHRHTHLADTRTRSSRKDWRSAYVFLGRLCVHVLIEEVWYFIISLFHETILSRTSILQFAIYLEHDLENGLRRIGREDIIRRLTSHETTTTTVTTYITKPSPPRHTRQEPVIFFIV